MSKDNHLKSRLYQECINFLNRKQEVISKVIEQIQDSLDSETKSSAGDKHETGRAMIHLERERIGNQQAELNKTKTLLSKIDIDKKSNVIGLGSLVYTERENYFISISAGKLEFNNHVFYAISPSTPIGQLFIGKQKGDFIIFNEQRLMIIEME